MQTTKATIKLADGFGRVVLISEEFGAILIEGCSINGWRAGDEVTIFREDDYSGPERRSTDRRAKGQGWKIEAEGK